jgi:two-component system NtrC family sensor kinase
MRRRLNWIPMAGFGLALASILAFLYVRTQGHDESKYFENVALLRQLKQLDARWELDVLKSKMGIDTDYDSLVDPLVDLHELQEKLQTIMAHQQQAGGAGALTSLSEAFHRAIEEKTRLIEHFKSHNSVLRNSLAFLPTAADDIKNAVRADVADNDVLRPFSADVNTLLLDSIVFSQAPSNDRAVDIQRQLERLSRSKGHLPVSVREGLDIFASHIRTVLREQPEVNALLSGIAAVPTAVHIDALDNILSSEQRETQLQAQGYRRYLLIFAAGLAGLLLYAAISLIRSHAVINRVNSELQGANATLEARVQERTRELHEAQGELVTTARQAGMAEIANNVLHNVGNVLTSVNVSARLIDSKLRDSKTQSLTKAVQLLSDHASDMGHFMTVDKKGKMLPAYLKDLAVTLAEERQAIADELARLAKSVDHIKEIVANQRSYCGSTTLLESVQVKDLLEDALRMKANSIVRHEVAVVKDFAEVPEMLLDKHLILQILVNLIGNATRAMDGVLDRAHQMTLRLLVAETVDAPRLRISVEDNGEGIAPENLVRLFVHGFTTRKDGHGFGLHSSALAAKQMDGTITAASDGPGRGAAFTLELPIRTAVYQS